jgi:Leucine-rich repeat (LRR) protein
MKNLKVLNLSRNMLSGLGIVGLLHRIITVHKESASEIKMRSLDITGCWLRDSGLAEMLPCISEFKSLEQLTISANRLTENSQGAFCDFLHGFPESRRLVLTLKLQDIRKVRKPGATEDTFTAFKKALNKANKSRSQVLLRF